MRRGRLEDVPEHKCREAVASLASQSRNFACPVRLLSGRVAAPMIDLVERV